MQRWRRETVCCLIKNITVWSAQTRQAGSFESSLLTLFLPNMNRVILQLVAVGFCFAVGQALQCYKCKVGFWDLCITTKTTCENGEQCFSGVGKAAGFVDIKTKGCLIKAECNQTKDVNFPSSSSNTTVYTMTKTCCDTDLCNKAPGLPGVSGLPLALATITALFVANVLV